MARGFLCRLNSKIEYKDFTFTHAGGWSAGQTLGARVAQASAEHGLSSNEYILGIAITYIGDSSKFTPVVFSASGRLYCNYYCASTVAATENNTQVKARLAYIKI